MEDSKQQLSIFQRNWNLHKLQVPFLIKIKGGDIMFTIAAILLVLWLLGTITAYTFGGLLHILLVIAIVVVIVKVIKGGTVKL